MKESISLAFLVLLEQLQPIERAVFLLREVFEYEYAEIAAFLGKSEAACRKWLSRAKKHLSEHRPRFSASPDTHRQLLTGFLQAAQAGEMPTLMNLLAEEVTLGRRRQSQRSCNAPHCCACGGSTLSSGRRELVQALVPCIPELDQVHLLAESIGG